MQTAFLVFVGGGFGSVLRWLTGLGAARLFGTAFPYGTLTVNIVGGLVMGILARALLTLPNAGVDARLLMDQGANARFLLMTGVLGGFTTFSAFSLDAATLYLKGEGGAAALYVVLSVAGSLAAVALGLMLGSTLTR
jgi:fluoride exporter